MVGDKIKHTCKNCGWWTSIRVEWGDLKPKRCMNKKCNTSFMKSPEALITQVPENPKPEAVVEKIEESVSELPKATGRRGKKNEGQDN